MTPTLLDALTFSANKHKDQRRKNRSKTPYINHPISVAHLIQSIGKIDDPAIIISAILHDTVEDTDATIGEIEERFGNRIAKIVMEVSDNKFLKKVDRKKLQVQYAKHSSKEAKIVKLADKLDNLKALLYDKPTEWSPEYVRGYFVWSYFVVENLRNTNQYLEDALDEVFNKFFKEQTPTKDDLEKYYSLIENVNKKENNK